MPIPPDIPTAKRLGLPVDIARLGAEGDGWLTPEQRYALKTYGVCAQLQPGLFMIRVRIPGGRLRAEAGRGLADLADRYGGGWIHLTTRQNAELHFVDARDVPQVLAQIEKLGLTTRSSCGHTMRNVMACPDAGVSLEEPFDCYPDARTVSDAILARSAELNCLLPSRVNIAFGGCPECRAHARVNDAGFVSTVRDERPGYQLWAAGSLGAMPRLAVTLADFVPREDAAAAAEALIEVFVEHGNFDSPKKARMKHLVEQAGEETFRSWFDDAFVAARRRPHPPPLPVDVLDDTTLSRIFAVVPLGGWGPGVRPQRTPGLALATINIPLGDVDGTDLRGLASLAEALGDGTLYLTRNQDVALRDVKVTDLPALRTRLGQRGLGLEGADAAVDVRACTGSAVCSLAISAAPAVGAELTASSALSRNSALRVHVSGCPNSCAQHQIADIGLSGAKVRIGGSITTGYHVWLGGDSSGGHLGEAVGRVAHQDVPGVIDGIVGVWEALRHRGETIAGTMARVGAEVFARQLDALADRGFLAGVDEIDDAEVADATYSATSR